MHDRAQVMPKLGGDPSEIARLRSSPHVRAKKLERAP